MSTKPKKIAKIHLWVDGEFVAGEWWYPSSGRYVSLDCTREVSVKIWQDRCVECTKSTCSTGLQQCTLNQIAKQIFGNGHNCNMYKIKPFHQIFSFDTCSTSVFQENS